MLSIVQSPDPLLNTVCEPCDFKDKSLKRLAKQMAHVMYKNAGCGLAAPQVGVLKRMVVIDCDQEDGQRNPIVMLNPVIVAREGDPVEEEEGCLSIPGISVPIARPPFARCRYYDLTDSCGRSRATGFWAAACSMRPTILMASPCSSAANLRLALKLCRSMRWLWPPVRDLGKLPWKDRLCA